MLLTATTRNGAGQVILFVLDRSVHPVLGIDRLGQSIELLERGCGKALGVSIQATSMNASLGDDHVVSPGVDKPDRAIMASLAQGQFGIRRETLDPLQLGSPGSADGHDVDLGRKATVGPAFRIEINPVPCLNQLAAKIRDVSLGATSGRINTLEIQGQVHGFDLRLQSRWFPSTPHLRVIAQGRSPTGGIPAWESSASNVPCGYAPGNARLGDGSFSLAIATV